MIQIYGIKNCDTMKKTLRWFTQKGLSVHFIDYKKTPPTTDQITAWLSEIDWKTLLNTRGTTWRNVSKAEQADLNEERAIVLMIANPSLIKRPVVTHCDRITVGYNETAFEELIARDK